MRAYGLLVALLGTALLAGCAALSSPGGRGGDAADSLRAENARLRDETRALQDSLQLYDDVASGQYDRTLRRLQDQINRLTYDVKLLREGGLTVAVLPTDSLFQSVAPDSLVPAGRTRLRALAGQLEQTYPERTVRVEGHTDDQSIIGALAERYPSNWELSAARAAAVMRRLAEHSALSPDQFVVVGYGSTRPTASNETAAGRRQNRRVRVAVEPLPSDYSRPFETAW